MKVMREMARELNSYFFETQVWTAAFASGGQSVFTSCFEPPPSQNADQLPAAPNIPCLNRSYFTPKGHQYSLFQQMSSAQSEVLHGMTVHPNTISRLSKHFWRPFNHCHHHHPSPWTSSSPSSFSSSPHAPQKSHPRASASSSSRHSQLPRAPPLVPMGQAQPSRRPP